MDINDLLEQATEILDLMPDGWTRDIHRDMSKLSEECGEVSECLTKSSKTKEDLGDELADVALCIAIIALKTDIDLDAAILKKNKGRIPRILKRFHGGVYPSSEG